ncbi:hypothetical protein [Bacillus sp. OV322]|uniref:hypothetical protein n=1 Tax=Bacillus sp. OV322 TaxID=1882764 RepID=UPI0015A5BE8E|nr:hypothetical protein [Bacillus sp. OV322]
MIMGSFFVILLTGCFGETYDYSPPTVTLTNPDDIEQEVKLAEANIYWQTSDKNYTKKTEDIQSLAKKQSKMELKAGQKAELHLENGDFEPNGISVSVWKNAEKTDLKVKNDQSFNLPKNKGNYMIVVDIDTDKGHAQYVGDVVIQ